VSGAVQNPGIYAVPAMSRVLTAIDMSGGFITEEFESQEETKDEKTVSKYFEGPKNPESIELEGLEVQPQENRFSSRRRITVKRQNRDLLHADIEKYLRTGDLDKNPILNGGDVIFVPFREEKVGSVGIYGAVRSPHEFEYVRGDKIKDMLEMAHGLATDADSSQIQLIRFTDKNTLKAFNFPLGDSSSVEYSKTVSTRLLPDDRLYVRFISNYHVKRNVTIRGQVLFPSTYPLTQTRNRLSDIIELAGGFTPEAYLESAYIIRKSSGKTNDPEYERLLTMRVMEMTELEREYFKFKARERAGLMPVDFRALFKEGNTNFDIPLADGDIIVIPAKGQSVSVFGQVVNPGLYSYVPGWTMEQYIDMAGGYNWNARRHKVRIIKSKHREWMDGEDDAPIQPGDQIFVPEKPVRNWWEIAKDVLVAATQLATIYLVIDRTRND
jgi:protein involved in polysaccharide export with SLBB domain